MQMPGNLWQEIWHSSKPVAAWRQKRLFDDTKEAEKILHSFSAMKPGELASLLLPTVLHATIYRLLEELIAELGDVADHCRKLIEKSVQIVRHAPLDMEQYEVSVICSICIRNLVNVRKWHSFNICIMHTGYSASDTTN